MARLTPPAAVDGPVALRSPGRRAQSAGQCKHNPRKQQLQAHVVSRCVATLSASRTHEGPDSTEATPSTSELSRHLLGRSAWAQLRSKLTSVSAPSVALWHAVDGVTRGRTGSSSSSSSKEASGRTLPQQKQSGTTPSVRKRAGDECGTASAAGCVRAHPRQRLGAASSGAVEALQGANHACNAEHNGEQVPTKHKRCARIHLQAQASDCRVRQRSGARQHCDSTG